MVSTYNNDDSLDSLFSKRSLKIMVDKKTDKLVFAEAQKDLVDFIFSLVSLPLSTVTQVLQNNGEEMVGSLGDLCKSIQALDTRYFQPYIDSRLVLKPRATVTVPLLSLHDCSFPRKENDVQENRCKCPNVVESMDGHRCPRSISSIPNYAKEGVVYMVMDNLEVKPMSSITDLKPYVKNLDDLEAKEVQVGLREGLAILKASLETKTVLTTVFLNKN